MEPHHSVWIVWYFRDLGGAYAETKAYSFATEEELQAFYLGIGESFAHPGLKRRAFNDKIAADAFASGYLVSNQQRD